jgi:hypothetical protein
MKLKIKLKWSTPLALLATAAAVTGCGGGGGGSVATPMPTPQNAAPVVSQIAAQTINQDTPTPALAFTVSDDGGVAGVTVRVTSSDRTVLPPYGLALGGSGANRTVTVLPAEDATGTATVAVTAVDAQGLSTSVTFPVTVTAVSKSIAMYTNSAYALMEGDTPVQVSGFTFVQDADDDATFAPLLQ